MSNMTKSRLVYMVIDLSYWNTEPIESINPIIKRILNIDLHVFIRSDHKGLVEDIPVKCDHVVNVDQSDRLFSPRELDSYSKLQENNWANFVKNKAIGIFEWRRPKLDLAIDQEEYKTEWAQKDTGWKQQMVRIGLVSMPWVKTYALSFVVSEKETTKETLLHLLPKLNNPRIVPTDTKTEKTIQKYCQIAKLKSSKESI